MLYRTKNSEKVMQLRTEKFNLLIKTFSTMDAV